MMPDQSFVLLSEEEQASTVGGFNWTCALGIAVVAIAACHFDLPVLAIAVPVVALAC
jgi:hypothetical protein